ncbi:WG repeat-containing protein [uncultured Alistipes sp.]|nr:WG repeat-containing protein [uncultured Alistipes sp.]
MISVRQYLFSVGNSRGLTRTLGRIDVCRDADGRMCYRAGNSAVVFKIRRGGACYALRCYTRKTRNLEAVYGPKLLRGELFVYRDDRQGEWTDVVVDRWVEGQTLHERIAAADRAEFARLAEAFDRLAAAMTADDCAHGDLKPENIVVRPDGTLRLIDFDASFLPAFAGTESPELGTAAFQHPARTTADFDARLDDFPAALISTALHALACDPTLRERYDTQDTLLIDPHRLPADEALREILALFERQGMALSYRIARLLLSPGYRLPGLPELFARAVRTGAAYGTAHAAAARPQNRSQKAPCTAHGERNSRSGGDGAVGVGEVLNTSDIPFRTETDEDTLCAAHGERNSRSGGDGAVGVGEVLNTSDIPFRTETDEDTLCAAHGKRNSRSGGDGAVGVGGAPDALCDTEAPSERSTAPLVPPDTAGTEGFRCAPSETAPPAEAPELFVEHGLWGYRDLRTGEATIPPLYDCGFDFTEGLAAVRLGRTWHFIDTDGHTVIRCPGCEAVKPFRDGKARILRGGRISEIDRDGHETPPADSVAEDIC